MALVLQGLATLSAAFFAGGAFYISPVEHPARMQAGIAVALAEFRPSYKRAAPWQAAMAAISLVSGVVVTFLTLEWAWALGGLIIGAVIPFTFVALMATNPQLLDTHPSEDEATVLLVRWRQLHWVRSILGTVGLLGLLSRASLR